ncbi:site-specific DNA-methyltransferase (adenine-specific) [Luteitalea sp. TBR-22]|uniref:DNA adenine methylase n=1 Tax=Luteitalea sp. TBR-22 TaxID=2802971 RepID=UPI001AF437D0|nr:Dam family site-specific DNA-(adenine-N6)-methyltransferase [Luteitalea sp. TBR-22]BCS35540.1 site-specific DNA-methyltransferase (adenine-specific) [Luteitalea sp. TBR-22]
MPVPIAEPPTTVATLPPPLKWAGGKRWQLPLLQPLWAPHRHRRLVEPFCGGLAVPLGLRPGQALLNDLNPHLINFYKWVQRGLRITVRLDNDRELYYAHRARFNALLADGGSESHEAASLFYFLNRTGYNGLCRFNRRNRYNVPFGRYRSIPYLTDLDAYREVLGPWTFTTQEFDEIPLRPDDFVYADPPYDVEFRQYASRGFTWDDQVRTAEFLAAHRGPVILANQATPRILELYGRLGFALRIVDAPRRISCNGNRAPAREVLATRNV